MNSGAGQKACDRTIKRLIEKAARRVFADGSLEPRAELVTVSLPATQASLPEYFGLERYADREEYHARIQACVNSGSIKVDWDRRAGERGQLERLTLRDPEELGRITGTQLPWQIAATACRKLKQVAGSSLPNVDHILNGWARGNAPGGVPPAKWPQFVDAMRAIDAAMKADAVKVDVPVRRLSAQLFGDSKRLESLARPLEFLLGDAESNDDHDHVFARLGLVKYPQPMLLSGLAAWTVHTTGGKVDLVPPYLGVRPDVIQSIASSGPAIRRILTIENLASFNEAAAATGNPDDLLLVYVAGNPTPSWLSAYRRMLRSAQPEQIAHWGDIDVGGFRIAGHLSAAAKLEGISLRLWKMRPNDYPTEQGATPTDCELEQAQRLCAVHGWTSELEALGNLRRFYEQELLPWVPPDPTLGLETNHR